MIWKKNKSAHRKPSVNNAVAFTFDGNQTLFKFLNKKRYFSLCFPHILYFLEVIFRFIQFVCELVFFLHWSQIRQVRMIRKIEMWLYNYWLSQWKMKWNWKKWCKRAKMTSIESRISKYEKGHEVQMSVKSNVVNDFHFSIMC